MFRNIYIEIGLGVIAFLCAVMAIGIFRERLAVKRRIKSNERRREEDRAAGARLRDFVE